MPSAYDFTTEHGLRKYLVEEGGHPDSIQLLTGGTANYVYRVTFQDSPSSIFKHAAPYLRSNQSFSFDVARMDFEAAVVQAVSTIKCLESAAHAVEFFEYDSEYKLLKIADGGQSNLKEAYTSPALDMREIAYNLAKWLATLHLSSRNLSIKVLWQDVTMGDGSNNAIAVNIYRHSYNNLHTALSTYGHDTQLAVQINEEFGSLLSTDNECLCHGDFWPGNILVRPQGPYTATNSIKRLPDLTIVDWELSRRGTSATDVGQFAAEAFLLDRFKGARDLRVNFLDAYVLARRWAADGKPIGKEWIGRMAVHWAVHVAFWPTQVPWADQQGTQNLVDIGVSVLRSVLASDWESLKQSPLFRGVSSDWTTAFLLD
jgi:thiamine kinase-like enzyme